MRNMNFLPLLGISFFTVISFTSCCTTQQGQGETMFVRGSVAPSGTHITSESYDNAGNLAGVWVEANFILCPWAALWFDENPDQSCPCYEAVSKGKGTSLSLGLQFSKQGGKYKEENGLEGKVATSYINFPILIRYHTNSGIYFEGGLQPGIILSAKDKYEGITDDYKSHFKTFDFGIPLEVGYEFKKRFGIGIRVTPGIANIDKEKDDADDLPNKNFVAGLRFSYLFGSKKTK